MLKTRSLSKFQRGLSLVELMVGIAVGLFVVAAAATLVASQLVDNRKMLLEVQVQQDLRATADIISRDMRRSSSWGAVTGAAAGVWTTGLPATTNTTPTAITLTGAAGASKVMYNSTRTQGTNGPYGFWRVGDVIKTLLPLIDPLTGAVGVFTWQPLTDDATMKVTRFDITLTDEPPIRVACPKRCADGTQACWPTVTVRSLELNITGQSTTDASVVRSVRSVVRVRNDAVRFNDLIDPTAACPA